MEGLGSWKVLEAGRSWKLEGLGSWKVLEAGRSWKLEGLGVCKVLAGSVVDSDDQQNKR
jgi:hypothetical protein